MLVLAASVVFHAACRKTPPAPEVEPVSRERSAQPGPILPKGFEKMSPAGQAAWLADAKLKPAREAKAVQDRAELVRPAPPDFKPENADRRIRLRLTSQKEMMRADERFWYRLELQNVGRKPIYWHEKSSFFKHGRIGYTHFKFFVRQPDGKEWEVGPPLPYFRRPRKELFPPGVTPAEEARLFKRLVAKGDVNDLSITLFPGETLVTRAWVSRNSDEATEILSRGEDPDAAIPGLYRELPTSLRFDQKGTYYVRVVYDDRLGPLTEETVRSSKKYGISRKDEIEIHRLAEKNALGPVQSNTVTIEVTP